MVVVAPEIGDLHGFVDLSSLAYPLLDAAVLALVVGLGAGAGRLTVVTAVVTGVMALNAVADSGAAYLSVFHVTVNPIINVVYQGGLVALALAALIAVRHDEPRPRSDSALSTAIAAHAAGARQPGRDAREHRARRGPPGRVGAARHGSRSASHRANGRPVARAPPDRRSPGDAAARGGARGVGRRPSARRRRPFGLLLIDLDHFKAINDSFGHAAGDRVLCEAAARLERVGRTEDTLARYGGEEFIVMLPELDPAELPLVAERYRRALADQPFAVPDGTLRVTGSVGAAAFPDGGASAEALIASGDTALYDAKRAGRDRVRVAAPALAA